VVGNGDLAGAPLLGCHSSGLGPHPLLVVSSVLAVAGVGFGLGGVLDVRVVQQILNSEQDLLNCDGWPPVFLLVQQRQANGSGRVNVGVEKWRHELDLGRSARIVVLEDHLTLIETSLPGRSLLARNGVLPQHQVHRAVSVLHWTSNIPEWMIFPPSLPLLRQTRLSDTRHSSDLL